MLKAAIVVLLLATVASLFSGLFFLVKDEGHGSRVVNALTVRVILAALTLAFIGSAGAGPVAEFETALRGAYADYRAALFQTNAGQPQAARKV